MGIINVFKEKQIIDRVNFLSSIGSTFDFYHGSKSSKIIFPDGTKETYLTKLVDKKIFVCAKKIAKQVEESNILDNLEIPESDYFNNQVALPECLNTRVINIDIKNAYPSILKNLGIIDKKTLNWLNSFGKLDKLTTLGILAKKKVKWKYVDGIIDKIETEQANTKNIFFYCVHKIDNLLKDLMEISSVYGIFYWVDGIYLFDDTPDHILQEIIDRIEEENLEYHYDICTEFTIKRHEDLIDISFFKEDCKKYFSFRDKKVDESWKSFLKFLIREDEKKQMKQYE